MVVLAPAERQDHLVRMAPTDVLGQLVIQVLMAVKVPLVQLALRVPAVLPESPERMELLANRVSLVQLVHKDREELTVLKDNMALLVQAVR